MHSSQSPLSGLFLAAALLLALGGMTKLRSSTSGSASGPTWLLGVKKLMPAVGIGEMLVGIGTLLVGGPSMALILAAIYVVFAVYVGILARIGADCGCFGNRPSPATYLHAAVNTCLAIIAFLVAIAGGVSLWTVSWTYRTGLVLGALVCAITLEVTIRYLPGAVNAWKSRQRLPGEFGAVRLSRST